MDRINFKSKLMLFSKNNKGSIVKKDIFDSSLSPKVIQNSLRLQSMEPIKYAKAHAKKVGKPVMLDFTGWACVNCRKMEEQVWSDNDVKRMLSEEVVLVSLYVDERTKLPEEDQYETTIAGKKKKVRTIGDQWMVLQAERYKTNSQPYYVLIDYQENQLGVTANYQDYGEVDLFKNWLQDGLNVFAK